jgi:hypothetical protein
LEISPFPRFRNFNDQKGFDGDGLTAAFEQAVRNSPSGRIETTDPAKPVGANPAVIEVANKQRIAELPELSGRERDSSRIEERSASRKSDQLATSAVWHVSHPSSFVQLGGTVARD